MFEWNICPTSPHYSLASSPTSPKDEQRMLIEEIILNKIIKKEPEDETPKLEFDPRYQWTKTIVKKEPEEEEF